MLLNQFSIWVVVYLSRCRIKYDTCRSQQYIDAELLRNNYPFTHKWACMRLESSGNRQLCAVSLAQWVWRNFEMRRMYLQQYNNSQRYSQYSEHSEQTNITAHELNPHTHACTHI